jgi:hypothetical protein
VAACRRRCWKTNWVIDLDVERFFDSVPWELVVKAVATRSTDPWVLLYVTRWLAAPLRLPNGALQQRDRGTPPGSAMWRCVRLTVARWRCRGHVARRACLPAQPDRAERLRKQAE